MYAVKRNNPSMARYLLEHGAEVNACDDDNATALIYAVQNNNAETLRVLIENNADTTSAWYYLIKHPTAANEKIVTLLARNAITLKSVIADIKQSGDL